LLHQADCVTATTHYLADQTAQYGDLDRESIEVIPFCIDLDLFRPTDVGSGHGPPRLIFLKHLCPVYGPEYLLRALPAILAAEPDARLSMVGTGPMRDTLQGFAEKNGTAKAIEWYGEVVHGRVPTLLAGHDVYVMPSVAEAFGVSAVEAQAVGLPVVCSDLPGLREAIQDGVGGLTVPPGDPEALANAAVRLLKDESLRSRMGRRGRQFVAERFNWHDNVSAMECMYGAVLGQGMTRRDVETLAVSGV